MLNLLILSLLPYMGSSDWETREKATKTITTLVYVMGDPYPLESALKHQDLEIRYRTKRIYDGFWNNDLQGILHNDIPKSDDALKTILMNKCIASQQTLDILPMLYIDELSKQGMHPRDIREKVQIMRNNSSLRN